MILPQLDLAHIGIYPTYPFCRTRLEIIQTIISAFNSVNVSRRFVNAKIPCDIPIDTTLRSFSLVYIITVDVAIIFQTAYECVILAQIPGAVTVEILTEYIDAIGTTCWEPVGGVHALVYLHIEVAMG